MKLPKCILLFVTICFSTLAMAQTSLDTTAITITTKSNGVFEGIIVYETDKTIEIKTKEFGLLSIKKKSIISEIPFTNNSEKIVTIKTKNGEELDGKIKSQDSAKIVLLTKYFGPVTILQKDIVSNKVTNGFAEIKKNAISGNIFGITPIAGITYERLLLRQLSVELGVGFISLGGGIKIFPFSVKANKPFFHTGVSIFAFTDGWSGGSVIYVPIGMSFFGKSGLNLGLDLGPAFGEVFASGIMIYGNLKLGIRF